MKKAYPTLISEHEGIYLVYVPDWNIYTEGMDIPNAIYMARDAIGLKGIDYENDKKDFPAVSSLDDALALARENTDIFDYSQGIMTLVDVDFTEYRKKLSNRSVKKNCTIPYWLNEEAEKQGINFSKVLQEALIKLLHFQN